MRPEDAIDSLNLDWLEAGSRQAIGDALEGRLGGGFVVVSSFGAESAVLLRLVAQVTRDAPVLFIDTGMMFQETLDYQVELAAHLGLRDVRRISANPREIRRNDVFGRLHLKDGDACCDMRKVVPLEAALAGFDGWISGRKRQQNAIRGQLPVFEKDACGRTKVNPLAHWTREDIAAAFTRHGLPRHPLVADGFSSIGCAPCTRRVAAGADPRSGRWAGSDKTECGIHLIGGRVFRQAG